MGVFMIAKAFVPGKGVKAFAITFDPQLEHGSGGWSGACGTGDCQGPTGAGPAGTAFTLSIEPVAMP